MRTDGAMKNAHYSIWHKSAEAAPQTLASAKAELCTTEKVASAEGRPRSSGSSWGRSKARSSGFRLSRRAEAECIERMEECEAEAISGFVASPMFSESAKAATSCVATEDVISEEQVSRIMRKKAYKSKA